MTISFPCPWNLLGRCMYFRLATEIPMVLMLWRLASMHGGQISTFAKQQQWEQSIKVRGGRTLRDVSLEVQTRKIHKFYPPWRSKQGKMKMCCLFVFLVGWGNSAIRSFLWFFKGWGEWLKRSDWRPFRCLNVFGHQVLAHLQRSRSANLITYGAVPGLFTSQITWANDSCLL